MILPDDSATMLDEECAFMLSLDNKQNDNLHINTANTIKFLVHQIH